jgi:hypothetical protein
VTAQPTSKLGYKIRYCPGCVELVAEVLRGSS